MSKRITVDGNTATAKVAYALSEVAAIYPITPSSNMAELADQMSGANEKNLFGDVCKVVEMQSEGGAAGALHGALSGGALATTFTASQGLLLMIPNMYKIAGELLPCVIHVSARSLASHALSIFGDHSDVMSVRSTGFSMLAASSVQEAQDMALVSHLSTLHSSVPFIHFFDGFRTSHEINTIDEIDLEAIRALIPHEKIAEFKSRALSSAHPHQQGTAQNPDIFFQNREACNSYYNAVPEIVKNVMKQVAGITGRKYSLFDYVGSPTAKYVIVMMGSGCSTTETTVKYLNKTLGPDYGLVKVRLFRPFSVKDLVKAFPKTTERIAVLDRTKEPGANGEPLYKDVVCALSESNITNITVVGGRYGLGSKEFTPSMVGAIYDNLKSAKPKNKFTIGIEDDVTNYSLPIKRNIYPTQDVTGCKFYGYGGDGTVSANKSSIKIIGDTAKLYGQAYFEYDSKKSGNATITNVRFGKNKIDESYLLDNTKFVAVHNQTYITKFNITKGLQKGGILLLNTEYDLPQLEKLMPAILKQDIAKKNIQLYTINAYAIANELGLGDKINLPMQSAFFKLINLIPFNKAKEEMKLFAKKNYGKKGEAVLQQNYKAIDLAEEKINKITVPAHWATAEPTAVSNTRLKTTQYYEDIVRPIERLDGDNLPVSLFNPRGVVPTGTSQYEKRGIANELPCWKSENCIQCNFCAFVCPHAVIRPKLLKDAALAKAPKTMQSLDATNEAGKKFVLEISPLDCTGCGVCESVCPGRAGKKAIVMEPTTKLLETQTKNYNFTKAMASEPSALFKETTVKGSQFKKPYFEFSGACAGCGETPYIKVVSQLFGDRMIIANATGCTSIYGGSAPTCPYTKDDEGFGPAWANSLFEDNAEFGYGIKLGTEIKKEKLIKHLNELLNTKISDSLKQNVTAYLNTTVASEQKTISREIIKELSKQKNALAQSILSLKDSFINQSLWIIGGDGWAYDIGYGGLDHVLASGANVNILVLDTEVYSNTGGQSSKSTPMGAVAKFASTGKRSRKKDLALMSTVYKDVYVAKVSMGANMNHFLKCVTEAEAYPGVSIIIAYAPCISHGVNMKDSQLEMKKAVECGYWNLWRYNPLLAKEGKNPFILDSGDPTKAYEEFLMGENRYKMLKASHPELADQLFKRAADQAKESLEDYKKLAK